MGCQGLPEIQTMWTFSLYIYLLVVSAAHGGDISDALGELQDIVQSTELKDVPTWVVLLAIIALLLYSVPPLFVLGMACSGPKDPCLQDPLLALTVFAGSFIAWPWIIL